MNPPRESREQLWSLLHEYNEYPEKREEVLATIRERFEREVTVLVLDSAGFSRTTRSAGIVHFLALLERLERTVRPIIEEHQGRVLRAEADNLFAVFPSVRDAVDCAVHIQRSLAIANRPLPAANEIDVSIGIGHGPMLAVGDDDVYGDEMNLACKLGEDLAAPGEIYLTPSAAAAFDAGDQPLEELSFDVSGLAIHALRVSY